MEKKNKSHLHHSLSKLILISIAIILALISCSSMPKEESLLEKENWNTNYTYVFVHGLSGWGHYDGMNKIFPYWGMKSGSLLKPLKKLGFDVHDASVAPQGSVWDRTCELYAQLTGTRTDYGSEHSARCGHERFGRVFSKDPLITKWDAEHKINLFGHSFGGVTVRLLAHLMAEGSQEERDATSSEDLSPLFKGGHANWIYSVTTLAAPHNGTSAYHIPADPDEKKSSMQKAMDKRNAPREDGMSDYDNAAFDMHIQNASEINRKLTTLKDTYYFSYSCTAAVKAQDGTMEPEENLMEKLFQDTSRRMGKFSGTTADGINLGGEWQENDGLVNTISALAPDFAPRQNFPDSSENLYTELEKGIWYVMPVYHGDHMSLQGGLTIKNPALVEFYAVHMNTINCLE